MSVPGPDTVVVLCGDEDRATASRLIEALARRRISAISGYEGPPEEQWEPAFGAHLNACKLVIVLWTGALAAKLGAAANSNEGKSTFLVEPVVAQEIQYARDRGKILFRIACDDADHFATYFSRRFDLKGVDLSDVARLEAVPAFNELVRDILEVVAEDYDVDTVDAPEIVRQAVRAWMLTKRRIELEAFCALATEHRVSILTSHEQMADALIWALQDLRGEKGAVNLQVVDPELAHIEAIYAEYLKLGSLVPHAPINSLLASIAHQIANALDDPHRGGMAPGEFALRYLQMTETVEGHAFSLLPLCEEQDPAVASWRYFFAVLHGLLSRGAVGEPVLYMPLERVGRLISSTATRLQELDFDSPAVLRHFIDSAIRAHEGGCLPGSTSLLISAPKYPIREKYSHASRGFVMLKAPVTELAADDIACLIETLGFSTVNLVAVSAKVRQLTNGVLALVCLVLQGLVYWRAWRVAHSSEHERAFEVGDVSALGDLCVGAAERFPQGYRRPPRIPAPVAKAVEGRVENFRQWIMGEIDDLGVMINVILQPRPPTQWNDAVQSGFYVGLLAVGGDKGPMLEALPLVQLPEPGPIQKGLARGLRAEALV